MALLLTYVAGELPDELEATWLGQYRAHVLPLSSAAAPTHDALLSALSAAAASSEPRCLEVYSALVVACLVEEPARAKAYMATLCQLTPPSGSAHSGVSHAAGMLTRLLAETPGSKRLSSRFLRLAAGVRQQLLWMVRELPRAAGKHRRSLEAVEHTYAALLRHVPLYVQPLHHGDGGGAAAAAGVPLSRESALLCASVVEIFNDNVQIIVTGLKGGVPLYACRLLRLVADLAGAPPGVASLACDSAAALCAKLLVDHWELCAPAGRDLLRLLRLAVATYTGDAANLASVYRQLVADNSRCHTLLRTRTSKRIIGHLIPPEVEARIVFLLTSVRMGNQRRYQDWFVSRILAVSPAGGTAESAARAHLTADTVRYIVACHHPPNHILASDVCQRWCIIGWLLHVSTVQGTPKDRAGVVLALTWDWLFYTSGVDSIMNLEPAMLLIMHSLSKYPDVSNTVLDSILEHVDEGRRTSHTTSSSDFRSPASLGSHIELVPKCAQDALNELVRRKVVRSLTPLTDSTSPIKEHHKHNIKILMAPSAPTPSRSEAPLQSPSHSPSPSSDSALLAGATDGITELSASLEELSRHTASPDRVATQACREAFLTLLSALSTFASLPGSPPRGKAMAPLRPYCFLTDDITYNRGDIVGLLCVELANIIGQACPPEIASMHVAVDILRFFLATMCRYTSHASQALDATIVASLCKHHVCGALVGGALLCEASQHASESLAGGGDAMQVDGEVDRGTPGAGFVLYRHACALLEAINQPENEAATHYYMLIEYHTLPPSRFLARRLEADACAIVGWDETLLVEVLPQVLRHLTVARLPLANIIHLFLVFSTSGDVARLSEELRGGSRGAIWESTSKENPDDLAHLMREASGWGEREQGILRSLVEAELGEAALTTVLAKCK